MKGNVAFFYQPFRVGKRNTGYTAAEPAGVDAEYHMAFAFIIIIFFVELGCNLGHFFILPEWVHDADAFRKLSLKIK
jgi:hypothetical protein